MDNIEKAMKQAKVSIEAEGLKVFEKYDEIVEARLLNKISEEEYKQLVMEAIRSDKDER
ncbi:hypothetical protein [Fictibacillus halophilus]|uniref:hypothetical protein n=1 Tax=Fictibacillus halophilus TaxID=1610490 RepID=UPI001CFB9D3D|nr:hypothetical protein [Fictibacillus halophilus]